MTSTDHANTPQRHLLPAIAVASCGAIWGIFWLPVHWFGEHGVGAGWVSIVFNITAALASLPWLLNRRAWNGGRGQLFTGLLLGCAFSLYTVSLVMTDVIHAILLFYLTPVWSTIAGRVLFGERLGPMRILSIILGFIGLAFILGVDDGVPLPRNGGDWLALISGMCWSAGTMRSYRVPSEGIALPAFSFALGGFTSAVVIIFIAMATGHMLAQTGDIQPMLPLIVGVALVIFVPPNLLVLWAAQRTDAGKVGILLMTEVLVGSISAALLSGDPFGASEALGTALIVGAGLLEVTRR